MELYNNIFESKLLKTLDDLSTSKISVEFSYPLRLLLKDLIKYQIVFSESKQILFNHYGINKNGSLIIENENKEGISEYVKLLKQSFIINYNTIEIKLNYLISKGIELSIIDIELLESNNIIKIIINR